MKFWQVAVLVGLGVLLGWFIWGRAGPPPPEVISESHTDTLLRTDTVETVPPAVKARLAALEAAGRYFLVDTVNQTLDTCLGFVGAFLAEIDSLKQALSAPPGVKVSLSDTLTFTWPMKALWVGVSYAAEGDSARIRWSNRQWPAPPGPKSRFGFGPGYGKQTGLGLAGQMRIADDKAIQGQVNQKGWEVYLLKFIK